MEIELESIKGKVVRGTSFDSSGDRVMLTVVFTDGTTLKITTYQTASCVVEFLE